MREGRRGGEGRRREGRGKGSCQSNPDISEARLQDSFLEAGTLALFQIHRHQLLAFISLVSHAKAGGKLANWKEDLAHALSGKERSHLGGGFSWALGMDSLLEDRMS